MKNPERSVINTSGAPAPVGPYSQAVRAGNLLFVSGQIPMDPATGAMVADGVEAQTRRVLENLEAILASEGLTTADVVKTTVFLTDLSAFPRMNDVYAQFFEDAKPARATVQVAALPKGANVEIEAIAHYPGERR